MIFRMVGGYIDPGGVGGGLHCVSWERAMNFYLSPDGADGFTRIAESFCFRILYAY